MSIVISIVKLPEGAENTKSTHTFALQGGTIGRSSTNDWILDDPERFISSQHSEISFENGQYYLTDLSTNGTFANGAPEPIGKGNTIQLNDGDKFALGDYEFLASVWQAEDQNSDFAAGPFATAEPSSNSDIGGEDYFSSANQSSSDIDSFASPLSAHVENTDSLFSPEPIETDPLAALDNARSIPEMSQPSSFDSNIFPGMSQSDQADPMQESISWPAATVESGGIPEDWDLKTAAAAVPIPASLPPLNKANFMKDESPSEALYADDHTELEKRIALEQANEKILAEIEILKKQRQKQDLQQQIDKNSQDSAAATPRPQPATTTRAVTNNEQSLIDALGFAGNQLSDQKIIEINNIVGELVRETITGMMQVLSSRSMIKNEFRMNVTTIQPIENNPLKFSANIDDAMENMFIKEGNAYKDPVGAIKEGFEGIAEHQVAILAGIRTAFKGVIDRFDPVVLEQRFEQFNKPGLIPGMSKSKNWDSYRSYYKGLVDDMDNSFQHLFGYEFVQAYEEQLQKLVVARKTKIN